MLLGCHVCHTPSRRWDVYKAREDGRRWCVEPVLVCCERGFSAVFPTCAVVLNVQVISNNLVNDQLL